MTNKFHNKFRASSHRLKNYDYSQDGAYFITICTDDSQCLLGQIKDERFFGNELSSIVKECWEDLPNHYENCFLDEFVIMPNHMHGIIMVLPNDKIVVETIHELSLRKLRRNMLIPKIIGRFKMVSTKKINEICRTPGKTFWQKDYYDRIIRDERELNSIREYIADNPLKWELEKSEIENLKLKL